MTTREQELLEENRLLRIDLDNLKADAYALRIGRIKRAAIAANVRLVKESELPLVVPWSIKKIKQARRKGDLQAYPDPLNPNSKTYFYNLDEVWGLIRSGRPIQPSKVVEIPADIKIAV